MTVSSLLDQLRKAADEPRDYEDDTGILLRKAIEAIEQRDVLLLRQLHEIEQLMTERDQYRDLAVSYAACLRVSAKNVDDLVRGWIAQKRKPKSK